MSEKTREEAIADLIEKAKDLSRGGDYKLWRRLDIEYITRLGLCLRKIDGEQI